MVAEPKVGVCRMDKMQRTVYLPCRLFERAPVRAVWSDCSVPAVFEELASLWSRSHNKAAVWAAIAHTT